MLTLDNTIAFHHLLLKISLNNVKDYPLPNNFHFEFYKDGDERYWIEIEKSAQEFINDEEGIKAWNEYYLKNKKDLYNRLIFLVNEKNEKIGTATSYYNIETNNKDEGYLHWVAIKKQYQGMHLAKPLITFALKHLKELGYKEAFISTQTTTFIAAKIYLDLGATFEEKEKEIEGIKVLSKLINHPLLANINNKDCKVYDEKALKIKNELIDKGYQINAFKIVDGVVKIITTNYYYEFDRKLNVIRMEKIV